MSPIELPTQIPRNLHEQSHNYTNTTKSNPIKPFSPPSPHHHYFHQGISPSASGTVERAGEEIGRKPLSNCFYGGAFPHCLTEPILWKRTGQDVRGLSPKAWEWYEFVEKLCAWASNAILWARSWKREKSKWSFGRNGIFFKWFGLKMWIFELVHFWILSCDGDVLPYWDIYNIRLFSVDESIINAFFYKICG